MGVGEPVGYLSWKGFGRLSVYCTCHCHSHVPGMPRESAIENIGAADEQYLSGSQLTRVREASTYNDPNASMRAVCRATEVSCNIHR